MNDDECKQFIKRLIQKFPGFDDSSRNLEDEQKREIYRGWAEAWRGDITLDECNAVLERLAVEGGISSANYREPGPFIRRLILDSRSKARHAQARRLNLQQRLDRLESARQLQAEFRANKRSLVKAFELLSKGVDETKALSNA